MQRIKKIIFEDEADIDTIENVADFQYMRMLRFNLKSLNAWPTKEVGENYLINYANLVIFTYLLVACILYLKIHLDTLNFFMLGHIYLVIFMTFVAWTRIINTLPLVTSYRTVGTLFLSKMHLFYFKGVSEYAMKTHRKVHFICHILTLLLTTQMYTGFTLFNVIPMWNNYSSGKYNARILYNTTYEHSVYLSLPMDVSTNFNGYMFAFVLNWILTYLCSTAYCMLDLLLSLMAVHLWGHLKILLHELETFPLPSNKAESSTSDSNVAVNTEMYSEEESRLISQKLKQCVNYHRLIADFTNTMSGAFGPMLLIYYAFHQVTGCFLLLECSQMTAEALMRYLPLSIILFQQLIQLSVIFELVGSTSEKLKDAVYGVPWQYMDTKNRRIVAIFLYFVREPIHVKAMGVVNVGVTTMATILKTSLTYYAFLRSCK